MGACVYFLFSSLGLVEPVSYGLWQGDALRKQVYGEAVLTSQKRKGDLWTHPQEQLSNDLIPSS